MKELKCPRCNGKDIYARSVYDIEYNDDGAIMFTNYGCYDCGETFEVRAVLKIVEEEVI